jgi:hypothetical protein
MQASWMPHWRCWHSTAWLSTGLQWSMSSHSWGALCHRYNTIELGAVGYSLRRCDQCQCIEMGRSMLVCCKRGAVLESVVG